MIIGITGASGSGKTLLSNLLKKEYNANVIDADKVVKEMSTPGSIYFEEIVKKFGKEIVLENGELDKPRLANIIFTDVNKKQELDEITYKYVVDEIKELVKKSSEKITIIDAPLLIESNLNKICEITISTIADKNVRLTRICKRDNIDKQTAITRINAQPDNEFYIKNSNYVIVNNKENSFESQIEDIKEIINSKMIKRNEIVVIQDQNSRLMHFKKLLEYNLPHAFTLKPFDFGSNDTYNEIKEKVDNNYKSVCELLKLDSKNLIRPYQTHTNTVKVVNKELGIFNESFIDVDGLITKEKNKILSLVFADCTPIYIYDKQKNIIGNIHSGWQGTVKKIAKIAIQAVKKEFNCNVKDLICIIGPTIRKCHFEVKQDVRDIFYNEFKYMNDIDKIIEFNEKTNTYFIDTVEINKNLLKEEGILEENIVDSNVCTVCNSNIMHSYRKEGTEAGRNTALISLI